VNEDEEVTPVKTTFAWALPIPSGNPLCRCASTDLKAEDGVALKFNEVTLTIFPDCPDHGEVVNDIVRGALDKLSVQATGPMRVLAVDE
jgi:hypothetical protein